MGMLAIATTWGLCGWFAALGIVIAFRCLSGDVGLAGILAHDAAGQAEGRPAPERVQLLVMFLFALVAYGRIALSAPSGHAMPPVPPELMALLGGSHSIYLSGKLTRALQGRKKTSP